ncbi:hypothetical protein [Paenibacillus turpanensis]|nr:hypothetical protein [Paenibacillus turpanensis]
MNKNKNMNAPKAKTDTRNASEHAEQVLKNHDKLNPGENNPIFGQETH